MTVGKVTRQRNFPSLSLRDALVIPQAIQDKASGMSVSKLNLAEYVGRTPGSSAFREQLISARAYGLTEGGVNGDRFELTQLGDEVTSGDELTIQSAMRRAVMNVEPYRTFLTAYNGKKIPASSALKDFLVQQAAVPIERAEECVDRLLNDAKTAGFVRSIKGSEYIQLDDVDDLQPRNNPSDYDQSGVYHDEPVADDRTLVPESLDTPAGPIEPLTAAEGTSTRSSLGPRKVFIAHGKNRGPLEEVKKILNQFKVPIAVAVDEAHAGRPISAKVAELMREGCSSAIFIFTADERFLREGPDGQPEEVWRPSENAIYELGAASVLYDRRIVILKERRVTFPSDFSDLGYIEFEADQIQAQTASLFSELVALDIIEVRAKG